MLHLCSLSVVDPVVPGTDSIPYAHLLFDAKIYFLVFGIILEFGGVLGFLRARSVPSLVAGGLSGGILIISALLIPRGWQTWMIIDLIVCLALAGRFGPALARQKYNPAAYIVPLAVIGAVLAGYILFFVVQA